MAGLQPFVTGLAFPEAPRWHAGNWWLSDMHGPQVLMIERDGSYRTVVTVPECPSGLGWLPDGRLLVVSMHDRRVMRLEGGNLVEHADLSTIATWHCNDMTVDSAGRAYVGNFGSGAPPGEPITPAAIALVDPDGTARIAASGLSFANGLAITPDGSTLIVGETRSDPPRLTSFRIAADGTLFDRTVIATFEHEAPDGIALDQEGAIWVASPFTNEVLRVLDGRIVHRVSTGEQGCYAVALGGADGHTLLVCTSGSWIPEEAREQRSGQVSVMRVEVPAA